MRIAALLFLLVPVVACGGSTAPGAVAAPPVPPMPPVPAPFAATDDVIAALETAVLRIDVLANDTGLPPGTTATLTSQPGGGEATVEADGRIRYEPEPGFSGTDTFTYEIDDGAGDVQTASVHVTLYETTAPGAPMVVLPKTGLSAREVGVIINDDDAQSVAVGDYYVQRRKIPAANVVHVSFAPTGNVMNEAEFTPVWDQVQLSLGPDVQALVITWTTPWRVHGMSITSAFALGYDEIYESDGFSCTASAAVDYYRSESTQPFTDHGLRPTMMLAGESVAEVQALIDRGVAADNTMPTGSGYMVRTDDPLRSVRWPFMVQLDNDWNNAPDGLAMSYIDSSDGSANFIANTPGILFYFTGKRVINDITTNGYHPGAVCDHMTSYGGQLTSSSQMSILRWLEAGATASYGTVIEPCNFTQKFPEPGPLVSAYYRGNTVIEAYWKSVNWPGEGIFVGEPLARPWGRASLSFDGNAMTIETTWLVPNRLYEVLGADSVDGPFEVVITDISIDHHQRAAITVPNATRSVYKLAPKPFAPSPRPSN